MIADVWLQHEAVVISFDVDNLFVGDRAHAALRQIEALIVYFMEPSPHLLAGTR